MNFLRRYTCLQAALARKPKGNHFGMPENEKFGELESIPSLVGRKIRPIIGRFYFGRTGRVGSYGSSTGVSDLAAMSSPPPVGSTFWAIENTPPLGPITEWSLTTAAIG